MGGKAGASHTSPPLSAACEGKALPLRRGWRCATSPKRSFPFPLILPLPSPASAFSSQTSRVNPPPMLRGVPACPLPSTLAGIVLPRLLLQHQAQQELAQAVL